MAARAPTDFNRWIDDSTFKTGKPILQAEVDKIIDDQVNFLQRRQIILCDCFWAHNHQNGVGVWTDVAFYCQDGKDMCGTAATTNHRFTVLAWVDDPAAVGQARIRYSSGGGGTIATIPNITSLTPTWQAFATGALSSNGTEEQLTVQSEVNNYGKIYVAGVLLFAVET